MFTVFEEETTDHGVYPEARRLIKALGRVHTKYHLAREERGLHIYLPCPNCVQRDGIKEVESRHLSVNLDRYFGKGKFAMRRGTYNGDVSGMCMKEGRDVKFGVNDLLAMPTLAERGIPNVTPSTVVDVRPRQLIDDGRGNMIPDHPGHVIPLSQLPEGHPALEFLKARKCDIPGLERRFRCGYCDEEAPSGREYNRWYRDLGGGFRDTPQGRIIFYADMHGVQEAWQARIIDKVEEGCLHYYWHPYQLQWVLVRIRYGDTWEFVAPFNDPEKPWKPSKYRTANDAARNRILFGFDAALEWNRMQGREHHRVAALSEGPLDAERFGPGMATLGKYLSDNQAKLLAKYFKTVIWARDNDPAGQMATKRIREVLAPLVDFRELPMPPHAKDPGELEPAEAEELFNQVLTSP